MARAVRAVIAASGTLGSPATFAFYDLGAFIGSLSPSRIALRFQQTSATESVIDVGLEFDSAAANTSAELFKEVLIRSEPEAEFECAFPAVHADTPFDHDWLALEVQPEPLCLPSGKVLAIPVSLLDGVFGVFRQAHVTRSNVAYRVVLERSAGSRARASALIPALAEISGKFSQILGLEAAVREAVDLLHGDGWSAQEQICIPRDAHRRDAPWIEALMRKHLRRAAPFVPDDLLPLVWRTPAAVERELPLDTVVARLREDGFLARVLDTIVPSHSSFPLLANGLTASMQSGKKTFAGNYAFVSYSHRDGGFVGLLLEALRGAGANYWIDSAIHAGARWDETLEEQIRNCAVLIACLSDEYQSSKYCRRELKFADLINKPIVPVSPAAITWQPGLSMMFQELQIRAFDGGRGFPNVRDALKGLAPNVFGLLSPEGEASARDSAGIETLA